MFPDAVFGTPPRCRFRLNTLKQDYTKAVEDLQKTAATGTEAEEAAALARLKSCEAALAAKAKEEGIERQA